MNKFVRPLLTLALATVCGAGAHALDAGYGNDSLSSQINFDSFNMSVRKRMESLRIGSVGQSFNMFNTAALFSSDGALAAAMAPSSRTDSYPSARRRQLDCVYYNGFTVWADLYQTWAKQQSDENDGYKHKVFGPAVGFDWTSGPFTVGLATTYGFAKMESRDYYNDRKSRQWSTDIYGQYNSDLFYISAMIGYGHNSIDSNSDTGDDDYSTNSVNLAGEFGWKFNWSGVQVTPHAGVRFFNDRRGDIDTTLFRAGSDSYHVFEIPVGVDVAYEIATEGMVIVPRARFGYTPELFRERNTAGGYDGARRSRNGFNLGLGLEAKITKSISAHVDYNANLRPDQYEHHWNVGMGFSF